MGHLTLFFFLPRSVNLTSLKCLQLQQLTLIINCMCVCVCVFWLTLSLYVFINKQNQVTNLITMHVNYFKNFIITFYTYGLYIVRNNDDMNIK